MGTNRQCNVFINCDVNGLILQMNDDRKFLGLLAFWFVIKQFVLVMISLALAMKTELVFLAISKWSLSCSG